MDAPVAVYPWIVGFVFFIPLDLCFSVWFFYLFAKSQRIIASMFGWHRLSWFPLSLSTNDRRMAWALSHCIMADQEASEERFHTIISRGCKDFRRTRFLKRANESSNSLDRTYSGTLFSDPVLYGRWNVFLDSVTVFCSVDRFCRRPSRGCARNLGRQTTRSIWRGQIISLLTALGSRSLGGKNLMMLTYLFFTDRGAVSLMPHQLEGFKMAERVGMNARRLAAAIMIAVAVGIVSSLWIWLHSAYEEGVASGFTGYVGIPWESFNRLERWLRYPGNTSYPELGFIGIGLFFSLIMMFLRTRFLWWPLHPVGYALSTSGWLINLIWFSFLVGWIIKWVILKYGGLKAYRNAVPFFLGLILGEYAIGCFWNLLGIMSGTRLYGFFEG